jgi:isoleucyl-tRNA synthetase
LDDPGNRAIAFSATLPYGLYEVASAEQESFAQVGEKLLLGDTLADQTAKFAKVTLNRSWPLMLRCSGVCCAPTRCAGAATTSMFRCCRASMSPPTRHGFVHTAPGHGEDDHELFLKNRKVFEDSPDPFNLVAGDGSYTDKVPLFVGKRILTPEGKDGDANGAVIKELIEAGTLLAKGTLRHQYPHSWRSKAPVIFRATPQWFAPSTSRFPAPMKARSASSRSAPSRRRAGIRARAKTASVPWSASVPIGCCRVSAPGACRLQCSCTRARASSCAMMP